MAKRKVLIVIHQLNIGGVQKSLISALNAIDYSQNEVTLYLRKNRLDLLNQVNKNVSQIIINQDKTHYYRKPYAICLQLLERIHHKNNRNQKLKQYIINSQMRYEKKHYFSNDCEFDVAISYISGVFCEFVSECISAKRKICFHFGSTNDCPEVYRVYFPRYDCIVSDSDGSVQVLRKCYPELASRIRCIKNYVDCNQIIEQANKETIKVPENKLILCSCGRFTNVKGFDLAVETAKILKDRKLDFLWFFVGDGSERKRIETLIQDNNLSSNIKITGFVNNPFIYINCCNIYVQPSREESYGLTITEALVLKKIVVSTRTVGGCEQIKDRLTGLLADIDACSLADGICLCINCKEIGKKITNNLKSIDYSIDYHRYCYDWKCLLEG